MLGRAYAIANRNRWAMAVLISIFIVYQLILLVKFKTVLRADSLNDGIGSIWNFFVLYICKSANSFERRSVSETSPVPRSLN